MEKEGRSAGPPDFGTLLRSYRLTAGLSQEDLAERAGMSAHGISALERGYRRTPQRGTLALLAGALALNDEQRGELEAAAARWVLLRDGGRASVLVGPWPDTPGSNLPLSLTRFVGREAELREVAALARDHRLVTLTGTGGVGKTQTALQVATALRDAGAVWFVGLAPLSDPSLVPSAIASALRVQEVPNRPLLETLLASLKNRTLLLLLDNCEHVVTQAATVAHTLLAGCPRVRILATSREPLRAAGEQTYRLQSLSRDDSVTLFSDRARAIDHRFTLTDENAPAVAELCRRLDGIPLAIELAAARMNSLSVAALAEKLEDCFRVLAGGERTALPRQQTMRAMIDWSYDSLTAPEQRVFERLSIFAGGCTLVSAEAVCAGEGVATADILKRISSLVDKSMVIADFDGIEPRYRLLESFRQYAREKLARRGEEEVVAHRHAIACLEFAEWLSREDEAESEKARAARARSEWDNWRAALEWTLNDRGDVALGTRLVGELDIVWSSFALLEAGRWIALALELVDERTSSIALARLHQVAANEAWSLRDWSRQLASSERALMGYREFGDRLGIVRAEYTMAWALAGLGRSNEAVDLLREAAEEARRLGARKPLARLLGGLAWASSASGDDAAARTYLAESIALFASVGAELSVALQTYDLSELECGAGNSELAVQLAMDALESFRAFNDKRLINVALNGLSIYLVSLARFDEAQERAREALAIALELQLPVYTAYAVEQLAVIATLRPRRTTGCPREKRRQVARLLGFTDLYRRGERQFAVGTSQYNRVLAVLRDAMGADSVAKLMSEGEAMTQEQAAKEALAL